MRACFKTREEDKVTICQDNIYFFLTKILLFEGLCISLHSSLRLSYAQNTPLVVTIAILQDKTLSLVVTCRDLMHRTKPAGPCLFTALLWIITSKNASGYALHIDTVLNGVEFGLRTSFSQLNFTQIMNICWKCTQPSGHPKCWWFCFFIWTYLEKFNVTSFHH